MARPGLTRHRKFLRLARTLKSEALALGHLELLWQSCYEAADDYLGDATDVEALACWKGKTGVLCDALLTAGGDRHGFIEPVGDGAFKVHDLWDHVPEYVRKRAGREIERKESGKTLSDVRAAAGRRGAQVKNNQEVKPANDQSVATHLPDTDRQTASFSAVHSSTDQFSAVQDLSSTDVDALANGERPADLLELWNADAHPSLARAEKLTDKRKRHCATRLRERPLAEWKTIIARVNASAFLRGEAGQWRASFDWLIASDDNPTKVLEGKYDDRASPKRDAVRGRIGSEECAGQHVEGETANAF